LSSQRFGHVPESQSLKDELRRDRKDAPNQEEKPEGAVIGPRFKETQASLEWGNSANNGIE